MKNERQTGLADRRSGNERRTYHNNFGFPFVDGHGLLVTEDRRVNNKERRTPSSARELGEEQDLITKFEQQTA